MRRVINFITSDLIDYLVALTIATTSVLTITQVFLRYVANSPLFWSEELTRYLIVWLTFLGASLGIRHQGHIAIKFVNELIPAAWRKPINLFLETLIIAYLVLLVWLGIKVVKVFMVFKSAALGIPQGFVFLAVPVGAALMAYHKIRQIRRTVGDS
ncbi:MAG: TRAP transporter small permease [Deltaproteobacteria bacterium]|nr:TRAP transporter small permease [Deltaproteobacteria bacterium]